MKKIDGKNISNAYKKYKCAVYSCSFVVLYALLNLLLASAFNATGSLVLSLIISIFGVVYIRNTDKLPINNISVKQAVKYLIYFAIIFILINLSTSYLINTLNTNSLVEYSNSFKNINPYVIAVYLLILAPISEEIIFRYIVFGNLYKEFNFIFSSILSSILFAMIHGTIFHMFSCIILGIFLCVVKCNTNILLCIIFHFLYNTGILLTGNLKLDINNELGIICTMMSIVCIAYVYFKEVRTEDDH